MEFDDPGECDMCNVELERVCDICGETITDCVCGEEDTQEENEEEK